MQCLFGMAFIISGALILAWPLACLVAEPSGNIFFPECYYDRPQPNYSICQAKRKQGKPHEALAAFEALVEEYPQEVHAYSEMIDIAVVDLRDAEMAESIGCLF